MNIKKVDDKPMVIHSKENTKLHVKQKPDEKEENRNSMQKENGVYKSYIAAKTLSAPVESATDAGKRLYRSQAAKVYAKKIKKVQSGKKIGRKTAKNTAKTVAKEGAKVTAKVATTAGTAVSPGVGTAIGMAAGYATGVAIDYKDMQVTSRNRKLKFFLDKLNAEEQQKDSFSKLIKDLVLSRVSMMIKATAPIIGLVLLMLVLLMAVVAIPVVAIIAVIYNSPLAIFFPSISSSDTTQNVLSAYVSEFHGDINDELANYSGYDISEKIYVGFEGAGTPDNFYDILAVYMVKHGNGDTATDMTDKAKENLKAVFDDMCIYSVSSRTKTDTDDEGNTRTTIVKEVNVEQKTYRDMIFEYGFDIEEQEMLEELMKQEYLETLEFGKTLEDKKE